MLISPKAWNDVRVRYEELGSKHGHDVRAMLRLLDWIRSEDLEDELFPHTSMFDLMISDRAEVTSGENTLRVSVSQKKVTFRYDRISGSTDSDEKTVPVADSVEMLREFLAYKFGVYRKKKDAQPGGTDNSGADL